MNLKKLAEQLGLSVSTVSKAFQDSYDISPVTKERILALARELNYQPNPLASSLRKQKSKTIAVILPEIANNFFSLAINGIESVASEKGYHVLIYITHEDHSKEVSFVRHLQSGRVEGIVLSLSDGTQSTQHLDELHQKGIPIVFFDRIYENLETTKVTTDDYESGYKATEHLIEQGCTKIAHLYLSKNLSIVNKRKEGYLQALKDHRLPFIEKYLIGCSNDHEKNYQLIRQLLRRQDRPDGIFSSFEKLAVLSYQACQELQLSIPNDVRIISFSNLETAALLNPSLTTITQPAYEIGRAAALALFEALEKKKAAPVNQHLVIPSELIQRRSTQK